MFTKSENRRAQQVCLGVWYQWERGGYGRGYRRVIVLKILGTHV
jgi:hypothetical protein